MKVGLEEKCIMANIYMEILEYFVLGGVHDYNDFQGAMLKAQVLCNAFKASKITPSVAKDKFLIVV